MPPWKQLLLTAYYYGTTPCRRWAARRAAMLGRCPVMVLFYHRVADEHPNPWTISNAQFTREIHWLRSRFDLVSLQEAQRRIRSPRNDRPAVSITFDDGYADNCLAALPLLVKERIPYTYFVASRHVLEGVPFPHDTARGRPLRPNTPDELKALVDAGVEIGSHTRTHADLGRIDDPEKLQEEVLASRRDLERAIGCAVRYFAFPYGQYEHLNPDVFHLARRAGYEAVCSAYGGYNFSGDDAFHLQRIHADPEMIRLKNWLTVDPRKSAAVRRYRWEIAETIGERECRMESPATT